MYMTIVWCTDLIVLSVYVSTVYASEIICAGASQMFRRALQEYCRRSGNYLSIYISIIYTNMEPCMYFIVLSVYVLTVYAIVIICGGALQEFGRALQEYCRRSGTY